MSPEKQKQKSNEFFIENNLFFEGLTKKERDFSQELRKELLAEGVEHEKEIFKVSSR